MSSARVLRCVAGFVPAALAVLALAEPAAAVLEGRNGRIAFTSGREGVNDNLAQLYLRAAIGSTGSGPLSPPFSQAGVQNRHPSWSPDRTKVVFAAGTPGAPTTEEFDLFVKDFETGQTTPLDLLEINDGLSSDHPAWSPDGTRIAYEKQTADNSPQRDIMVKTFGSGQPAVALTTGGPVEFKPAWSPDSRTIYYARTNPAPANDHDIVRRDANGGGLSQILFTPVDEYQPAISPDGTKLCYTRQITVGNAATAEIVVAPLADPGASFELSSDPAKGDINCTWSPDGRKIAYTNGVFSQGRLVMENADNSSPEPVLLEDDTGSNNFDGNADWAPDGSPDCPDRSVTTTPGTAVTIEIECTDTGPAYERTDPSGFVKGRPAHGEISDESPTSNPSTVRYTPAPGFTGTDTLSFSAFDAFGFGTDDGKVTITVAAPGAGGGEPGGGGAGPGGGGAGGGATPTCAGKPATIVGTPRADTLRGTPRADVIVARGGNDRVRAAGGADRICGGRGADRLAGGRGRDRIDGGAGRDRCLSGVKRRCERRRAS